MSNNETGFIKILLLVLVLGLSHQFSGCAKKSNLSAAYETELSYKQEILNGTEVTESSPISKKVLYLATGARLLKTPNGGYAASQTGQCTATAITTKMVLTAAHCLKQNNAIGSVYVILGRKPWKAKFNRRLWYIAEKIFIHPGYKKNSTIGTVDDIALIQLKFDLPKETVTELATASELSSTMNFTMAGFGLRSNLKNMTEIENKQNIGELFQATKEITNYEINDLTISIDQHDQTGICSGDSGGPGLIYNQETKKFKTIGVVSGNQWTVADKAELDPENKLDCFGYAIYTNIMNPVYFDWIQKTIQSTK